VTAGLATAGELAFATPRDWFPIRLPETHADAEQLASAVVATLPARPGLLAAVEEMLGDLVVAASAVNAIGAFGTVLDAPAGPLPATVIVSVQATGGSPVDQIAREMAGADDAIAPPEVDTFALPAGRTIRTERLVARPAGVDGRRPVSFTVMYLTEVPGREQAVVLIFATPAIAQADRLRLVFHQIACSLCVNPVGRVNPPGRSDPPDQPRPAEAR
jgi:hypothetical protein